MADSQLEETGMDLDAASDQIGASLFGSSSDSGAEADSGGVQTTPAQSAPAPETSPPVDLLPAPKSWRQDMHQYWAKMPREAQQYYNEREQQMHNGMQQYKQIQSVIAPFEPQLSQRGVTPYAWIRNLAQAEAMLTQGTPEQRRAAYQQLGKQLGFDQQAESQTPVDPAIRSLEERLNRQEQQIRAQHDAVVREARTKIDKELEAFAADKAHQHFNEVMADESPRGLLAQVEKGLSLQDAYDAAVWANPVTRAKEQAAALTAHEAKLKENARLAALPKRKAAGVNIKSDRDVAEPTEPLGSFEDTIRSGLREIRARA